MKKLNLGCGYRYNPDWTNLDFRSTGPDVVAWDLRKGIPFPEDNFDLIYHSHLLEHFSKNEAEKFMHNCFQVLRPGGVLRVGVPDLETITRSYLRALELCVQGSRTWPYNYQWLMLELFDQAVRNHPGGDMKIYLTQCKIPNKDFIISRCGIEAIEVMDTGRAETENAAVNSPRIFVSGSAFNRLKRPAKIIQFIHEILKKLVLGKEYQTLQLGRFKSSGEPHQWMYDRYSLSDLLKKAGFEGITRRSASQSYIEDWADHCLDADRNGVVYKPDSIFMEGLKPSR